MNYARTAPGVFSELSPSRLINTPIHVCIRGGAHHVDTHRRSLYLRSGLRPIYAGLLLPAVFAAPASPSRPLGVITRLFVVVLLSGKNSAPPRENAAGEMLAAAIIVIGY